MSLLFRRYHNGFFKVIFLSCIKRLEQTARHLSQLSRILEIIPSTTLFSRPTMALARQ